jgi:hypothetical protein
MSNIVEIFSYKDLHRMIGTKLDIVLGLTDATQKTPEYKNIKIAIKKFLLTKSKEYSHVNFVYVEIKTKELQQQITKLLNFTEIIYPKIVYIHDKTKALVETSPDKNSMYIVFKNCMEQFYKEPPQYTNNEEEDNIQENAQDNAQDNAHENAQDNAQDNTQEKFAYLNKKYKSMNEDYLKNIINRKKIENKNETSNSSESSSS